MFCHLCCWSTSLMLQLVVGGVIAEVVVVVAGYQPYPFAHSTHVCPFLSLTHSSLLSSHSHHDFGSVGSSRTGIGRFWSQADISLVPRVAEHPRTVNSCPCCCFVHPQEKLKLFSLTQRSAHPHVEKSGMYSRAFCCWV